MAVNLKTLSNVQLNELIKRAEARKGELRKLSVAKVRAKVEALIQAEGFTFAELYGTRGKRGGKRGKVAPKYRNPADHSVTWSGRGKRPHWFNAALRSGKTEKSMLIK